MGARQTGNETWAANVARELSSYESEDYVFVATEQGRSEVRELTGSEPVVASASSARRLVFDLPAIARRHRVDALLVQYTQPLSHVPAVVAVHDVAFRERDSASWMPMVMRLRLRAALHRAARSSAVIVTTSEFTRREILTEVDVDPNRVLVAPAAVDPALAALLAGRRRQRESAVLRILVVGTLFPRKNVVTVARAVARLNAAGVAARLRVVGRVPDSGRALAVAVDAAAPGLVDWAGFTTPEQLAQEYVDADVLVFPSLYEGFGIPVVEAMQAGLAVVVSDRGALPEAAGSAAQVVPALDVDAWVTAVENVATAEQRRPFVAAGHVRAREFSWRASTRIVRHALHVAGGDRSAA